MNFQKKQQPVACCTICGAYGNSLAYINQRCGKPIGGNRCNGIRQDAKSRIYWKECFKCEATGRHGKEECYACLGRGWFYLKGIAEVSE